MGFQKFRMRKDGDWHESGRRDKERSLRRKRQRQEKEIARSCDSVSSRIHRFR